MFIEPCKHLEKTELQEAKVDLQQCEAKLQAKDLKKSQHKALMQEIKVARNELKERSKADYAKLDLILNKLSELEDSELEETQKDHCLISHHHEEVIFDDIIKAHPDSKPEGYALAKEATVRQFKDQIDKTLGEWDIVGFHGGKIDGHGHGSKLVLSPENPLQFVRKTEASLYMKLTKSELAEIDEIDIRLPSG